jgi:hypothetical protein
MLQRPSFREGQVRTTGKPAPETRLHPILIASLIVFLISAYVYGAYDGKSNRTILDEIYPMLVVVVYAFSLYCWFLAMLMSKLDADGLDFVGVVRKEEQDLSSELADRLNTGDVNNER